jgi:CubicO group peptidase (beta-lactamase class C family)
MIRERLIFFICVIYPLTCHHALAQDVPKDLGQYVARAVKVFDVPGVSVVIVKDGKLVVAKGYGVRKLGESFQVDEYTMFGIGSNTKAFTTAALATLVDEERISWDDPVYGRLPGFAMYDPYVSHEMTIRDLLAHRSGLGLGEGDLLFLYSTYTREEIISKLRFLKPAYSFRSRFGYDNLLYMAAGQIIPAVTGKSWDEYIRERIFAPLGMTNSNVSTTAFKSGLDYAWPHSQVDGKLKVLDFQVLDNVGPAGSINSCAIDIAKWIQLLLNHGKLDDRPGRIFSEKQSQEMWSPQTIFPIPDPSPRLAALKLNFSDYGLGWMLREYRGHRMVTHGGGVSGFVSNVVLLPDDKLGVAVLSNAEEGGAPAAILYHVVDDYLRV